MSEQQTKKWMGISEPVVLNRLGDYKKRTVQPNGYSLLFDYSTQNVGQLNKRVPVHFNQSVTNLDSKGNPILVPKAGIDNGNSQADSRYAVSQLQKFMEFYFDSSKKVTYVYAEGYPDSIYYVKRK